MSVFPSSVAADGDLHIAKNNLATTLAAAIDDVTTTILLTDASQFPIAGYVSIDSEAIRYTNVSGNNLLGVIRGADGTTATSHLIGAVVSHNVVAAHHNVLKDEIKAIEQKWSDRFTLTDSRLFVSSAGTYGRVGIGTNTPSTMLHIYGANSEPRITFEDIDNHKWYMGSDSTNSFKLVDLTVTLQRLVVDGVGRVGVGPSNSLSATFNVNGTTAGTECATYIEHSDNTNTSSHARIRAISAGASGGDPYATFTVGGATSWSLGVDNSDADYFKISQSTTLGTSDRIIVNSSGYVGIGDVPTYPLTVASSTNTYIQNWTSPSHGTFLYHDGASSEFGTTGAMNLKLDVDSITKLTIFGTSGHVNIGSNTDNGTLTVSRGSLSEHPSIVIDADASNTLSPTFYLRNTGTADGRIRFTNNLLFIDTSDNVLARITSSGRLGIGTTGTPSGLIHAYYSSGRGSIIADGSADASFFVYRAGALQGFVQTDGSGSYFQLGSYTNLPVEMWANNTKVAQFDANGTAGNTRFMIYDVDNATIERVSVGAADSGGTGYKVLRIPN